MGAGGVIVPPPGYHRRTRELCRRYDMLYIADEVVTAFGRLGHFFASKAVFDSPRHHRHRQGHLLGLYPARRRHLLRRDP